MSDTQNDPTSTSEIDKAINAAKARKAARGEKVISADGTPKAAKAPRAPRAPKATDEAKLALKAAKAATAAAKRAARQAKKAAAAPKATAHMKKVEKAAERLGTLSDAASLIFNEATASLSALELGILAGHLQHFNRVKATSRAAATRPSVGQTVTIVSGDPRYVGRTGTVTKSQRIRMYVQLDGVKKPVYLFTSDAVLANDEATEQSASA